MPATESKLKKGVEEWLLKRFGDLFKGVKVDEGVRFSNNIEGGAISFTQTPSDSGIEPIKDLRKEFNKDELLKELKTPPKEITIAGLKVKIRNLRALITSLKRKGLETSIYDAALCQLENRKVYGKVKGYLESIPITTREKIDNLAITYKLVFRGLGGITREMPLFVVTQLETFCSHVEKSGLRFEKDDFFLVAPEDWWQKKRDPILLVRSPFGNYFYIICAWDKEVAIVEELFE